MTEQPLNGRRILVTGGASGMGAGLVRALPRMGARVVSLDLTHDVGDQIAQESGAKFIRVDVTSEESVSAAVAEAVRLLGGLDVLVHAAGIAPGARAEETDLGLWSSVMTVNATGTFLMNKAVFPYLRDDGGRIINFASAAGVTGYPAKPAYAASKGAVVAWTRSIATTWAEHRITANCIVPAIRTPMYETTRSTMTTTQLADHDAAMATSIPLGGRLGDVDADLVPVVAFLAGEGSRFMTGQLLAVDGGSTMVR